MHKLRTLHLFAGAGGGILADILLGHQPVCAVEINSYCQQVLAARQEDGCLPWFPIFADVEKFDGIPWRGLVDVVSGGFPCVDISCAGKGAGIEGARSGLWKQMARIVGEVRPRYVFVENSPMLIRRGLAVVLGDLAEMGYDAEWCIVSAADVGAPHKRDRIWIRAELADSNSNGAERCESKLPRADSGTNGCSEENMANASSERLQRGEQPGALRDKRDRPQAHGSATERRCTWWDQDPADVRNEESDSECKESAVSEGPYAELDRDSASRARPVKSFVGRVASGVAHRNDFATAAFGGKVPRMEKGVPNRVDRLKALGNGQVPICAASAFRFLNGEALTTPESTGTRVLSCEDRSCAATRVWTSLEGETIRKTLKTIREGFR